MPEPTCKDCKHFHQHYTLDASRATPLRCGHCSYPRLKSRRPDKPVCGYFKEMSNPYLLPNREEVINFLTTDVLKYIMELKLPPDLEQKE